MRIVAIVGLVLTLSACALPWRKAPPVDELVASDAHYVGAEISAYVADVLPPASSRVWIHLPPPLDVAAPSSPLDDAVGAELRSRGFAVVEGEGGAAGAHRVQYDAFPLDAGVVLQVSVDGELASRFYARDLAGALAPAAAFTVRDMR